MDDNPTDQEVENEADKHRPKALGIKKRHAEEVHSAGTATKFACNVRIKVL